jgi:hypothetical protein
MRRIGRLLNLLLFLALVPTAHAGCENETLRSRLGERNTYPSPRDLAKRAREGKFETFFPGHLGARWLRVRFKAEPPGAPWSLVIRNQHRQVLESYGASDLMSDGNGTAWTGRLPADQGIIFDTWPEAPQGILELREYVAMVEPPGEKTFYSTAEPGIERWQPIEDGGSGWMRQADNVGLVMPSWEHENRGCSGLALAGDLLLTNWHCGWIEGLADKEAWNDQICRDTLIDFSFDGDQRSAEYRCIDVLTSNDKLDYALLRIKSIDLARHLRGMTLATERPRVGTDLVVLHHPAGLRKQLSRECIVLEADKAGWRDAAPSRFTHLCDTAPGSSGAPVLDEETGRVVGLHHRGVERDLQTCKENEEPRRNKAIWIGDIVADLLAQRNEIEAKLGHLLTLRVAN